MPPSCENITQKQCDKHNTKTTSSSYAGPLLGSDCNEALAGSPGTQTSGKYACLYLPGTGGSDDASPICTLEETEKDCEQKNMKCPGCGWYGPIPGAKDCNDANC